MKQIKLTNSSKYFIVDDEDYERINQFCWSVTGANKKQIHANCGNGYGVLQLPNFIMNYSLEMFDHKDRNFLNNQKENLRVCNASQNGANKEKYLKNTSSKYKGVSYCQRDQCWRAHIKVKQKGIALGTFSTPEKAANYNRAALEHFGEFAVLNKVEVVVS